MTRTHVLAAASAMTLAWGAHAQFFAYHGDGSVELLFPAPTNAGYSFETTVTNQSGGFGFTGANGLIIRTFGTGGAPDIVDIALTLEGATPADRFSILLNGPAFGVGPLGHATFAGTAEITEGFGAFAGLNGIGEFSGSMVFDTPPTGDFQLTLLIDVVPAPGAAAVLGLAGLLASRRRRS